VGACDDACGLGGCLGVLPCEGACPSVGLCMRDCPRAFVCVCVCVCVCMCICV
jgi:hypothetical protein